MYVIKDLVPDMNQFYAQYKSVKPWLQLKEATVIEYNDSRTDGLQVYNEVYQSKEDRAYSCAPTFFQCSQTGRVWLSNGLTFSLRSRPIRLELLPEPLLDAQATSWMGCTSASCAPAAPPHARVIGGIQRSTWGRRC